MSLSIADLDIDVQLGIFAAILEQMTGLVAVREMDSGKLIYINAAGANMLGTDDYSSLEMLMEQNLLGNCNVAPAQNTSKTGVKEIELSNIKGEKLTGLCEEQLLQYKEKKYCLIRITEAFTDQRYRQQLNKEAERFGALFDFASIGILVTTKQGLITLINDFALQQFGYEREALTGKPIEILIPQHLRERHIMHRAQYNEHPQSRPMGIGINLCGVKKNGAEFPVEISLSHYSNEEGDFVIAYINDITERKIAEERAERLYFELEEMVEDRTTKLRKVLEELQVSQEELKEALQKEKELGDLKSRFVSMASHEFRTPLSTILSSAFLVKHYDAEGDQPVRHKHIKRIINNVGLLTETLNDFLSVGKIEEGKIQVRITAFDLEDHTSIIIQEMQAIIKEQQIILYQHKGRKIISLDASLLKHIIMNLLGNAIKFSKPGTAIEITTEVQENEVIFKIKDYGIGMSEEDKQHLFEQFYRGGNTINIQGTGLGLHIVQRYTEMLKGSIQCNSILNEGTTFVVTFPLHQ